MDHNQRGMGLTTILVVFTFFQLILVGIYNLSNLLEFNKSTALLAQEQLAISLAHSSSLASAAEFVELANKPGTEVFSLVRGEQIGSLDIPIKLPYDLEGTSGLELHHNIVKVANSQYFDKTKKESYGILEFQSQVRFDHSSFRSIDEKVSVYREYRTLFTGFPRPFNQMLFYINDPTGYLDGDEFNQLMAKGQLAVNTIDNEIQSLPTLAREAIDSLVEESPKFRDHPELSTIIELLENLEVSIELPFLVEYPKEFFLRSTSNKRFDATILKKPAEVLRGYRKLRESAPLASRVISDIEEKVSQIKYFNEDFEPETCRKDLEKYLKDNFNKVENLTEEIKANLTLLSDFQLEIEAFSKDGSIAAMESEPFNMEALREKAFFVLKGDNVQEQWIKIKDSMKLLNGIVFIDNLESDFKLEGKIQGKLTIVCSGNVSIDNLTSHREGRDHLNVLGFGDVRVSGQNRFNLFSQGQLKFINTRVEGVIYLAQSSNIPTGEALITFNPDNGLADDRNFYYFALGPRQIASIINGE